MKRHSYATGSFNCSGPGTSDYYSAEFAVNGLDVPYQFRIWEKSPKTVSVLVKEDSGILHLLKVGDLLDVKYYSSRSAYPSDWQKSAVRHITRNDDGRLRGHYLVGLEIVEKAGE